MRVDQFGIQDILEKCPKLRVLKLDQVYNTDEPDAKPIDRASFFAAVAKSCRLLRCFHFSVCSQEMNPQEASSLIQNFFPESQMPDSNMAQKSTEQQRLLQQCHLDTLSLLESDVKAPISQILLAPLLRTSFEGTITTLEIIPSIEQPQNECLIHALHNVLCSAPSLLRLLAPTVTYFTQYLDLSEQIIIEKPHSVWSCITGCFAAEPDFTKKRIWACRGLRILQLRFGSKIEREDVSTEDSKAVFGYISRVCPNLRELLIYQQKMNLEMDSGFCLLSKLTFLQRLILMTWKTLKLQKRDLKWMARHPEVKPATSHYRIWSSITSSAVRNHCISNKPKVITVTENSTLSSALTVESLCGSLSVTKTKEYREQIEQGLGEEGCWPRLEFLGIRHCGTGRDHPASYLPALIKSIRPDVEFSCKYEELLKGSL
ncbi:hypothetical protein BGZ49_007421 [Haplosporangium sp. Z 27]|nr:hypothetical protein BGZ49_007421 [Haplosporangium sp. Z 27]